MVLNGEKWYSLLGKRKKKMKKGSCEVLWQRGKEKEYKDRKMGEENVKCALIAFTNFSDY